jgi:hypothetical protein
MTIDTNILLNVVKEDHYNDLLSLFKDECFIFHKDKRITMRRDIKKIHKMGADETAVIFYDFDFHPRWVNYYKNAKCKIIIITGRAGYNTGFRNCTFKKYENNVYYFDGWNDADFQINDVELKLKQLMKGLE